MTTGPAAPDTPSDTVPDTVPEAARILGRPGVQRVLQVLAAHGIPTQVTVLDAHASTAAQAAEALGVDVAQIANSLVFAARDASAEPNAQRPNAQRPNAQGPSGRRDGGPEAARSRQTPLLVLTSGAHRVDPLKIASLTGIGELTRADADFVREHTGFAIGGVAPVGHPTALRTLVDVSLSRYAQVWAAAGHPRTVFATSYDELVRITNGQPIEVV